MLEPTSLLSAWNATVARSPSAPALIESGPERTYTRAALDALATDFASALPASVSRQRVAFALPNGAAWFAAFLGLLRAEATPVPLDPTETAQRQHELARSVRASFAWVNGELSPTSLPLRSSRHPAPGLIKVTSGTSGTPKAIPFTHAQMLADGRHICVTMGILPDDINLAIIPFGHSYGLGNLVVPLLAQGTALVCADTPLPHALAALATRHRPTVFPAVPALLRALAEADLTLDAFRSIRTVISAGSALPAATGQAFYQKFGLKPHSFYGSTETGGIAYDSTGDDTLQGLGVGRALQGVTITQRPRDRIHVSSAAVSRRNGHRPADRARLQPDGRLVLLGRTGRMLKVGGRRLDLGDLEAELRRLPGILDAFVAPHPDEPEHLAAVLATPLSPLPLRVLLRAQLAPWKTPRRIVAVAAFPLTPRGKPDPAALRALLLK
ncbi:MAG: class I adenylate-forming enzyme family protein [Verrucomicrobia bacterium]|nr:class I adenylate-forming enzyme family protein [Verrucomicrobiota bacterium]